MEIKPCTCSSCNDITAKSKINDDFERWWHNEGSGMRPINGKYRGESRSEDTEEFVHRVCRIAWMNGAHKAKEDERV